jgi:hypothetical protein
MKAFYVLCSIPAAVAFWFGAQASSPFETQEPEDSEAVVSENSEIVVVTQEGEDGKPKRIRSRVQAIPRGEGRMIVRSADGPAVYSWNVQEGAEGLPPMAVAPGVPGIPGTPAVPGVAGIAAPIAPATGTFTMALAGVGGDHSLMADDETRKAFDALKKARADEDDDAADEALDALREALDDQYDKYLERQQEELEKLAKKLDDLKTQLEKRRDAKEDVVELKLKTLENQASGLGWPTGEFDGGQMFWRSGAPAAGSAGGGASFNRFHVHPSPIAPRTMSFGGKVETAPEARTLVIQTTEAEESEADDEATADEADRAEKADAVDEATEKRPSRNRRRRD